MSNEQPRNPLHGLTLQMILDQLVAAYGWERLSTMVRIQCFTHDPSVSSSLKFLRRTPWARAKVESLYLWHLRELKREARRAALAAGTPEDLAPDLDDGLDEPWPSGGSADDADAASNDA